MWNREDYAGIDLTLLLTMSIDSSCIFQKWVKEEIQMEVRHPRFKETKKLASFEERSPIR